MFGNIHAIIRRQNLRKEKKVSRSSTLETRKNNLISNKNEKLDKKHSEEEVQKAIYNIKIEKQKERKKNLITSLIIGLISLILTVLIYHYFF